MRQSLHRPEPEGVPSRSASTQHSKASAQPVLPLNPPSFCGLSHELTGRGAPTLIQTKLSVGTPTDHAEQEAEQAASTVMRQIQGSSEAIPLNSVTPAPITNQSSQVATPAIEQAIEQVRGQGQSLPDSIRQPMEQAFGTDFNSVRVHTDAHSHRLNQALRSQAFTTRHDIFFRQGKYSPKQYEGQKLLAHELAHVTQQNGDTIHRLVLKDTDFNERPSQPYRREDREIPDIKIDHTLHHVVPWNQLSLFVRTAYKSGHQDELIVILGDAVATMMKNSPEFPDADGGGAVKKQGKFTQTDLVDYLHTDPSPEQDSYNSEMVEAIAASFAWMPGNLFHGPSTTIRTDDPGESFEENSQSVIGEGLYASLKRANTLISQYAASPTQLLARQIVASLLIAALIPQPIPYNAEKWEKIDIKGGEMYRLKGALITPEENKKIKQREDKLAQELKKKEEEEKQKAQAFEDYKNRKKEESDDDEGGLSFFDNE